MEKEKGLGVEYIGGTNYNGRKLLGFIYILLLLAVVIQLLIVGIHIGKQKGNKERELAIKQSNIEIVEEQRLEIVKLKYDLKQMEKYAQSRQALCKVK